MRKETCTASAHSSSIQEVESQASWLAVGRSHPPPQAFSDLFPWGLEWTSCCPFVCRIAPRPEPLQAHIWKNPSPASGFASLRPPLWLQTSWTSGSHSKVCASDPPSRVVWSGGSFQSLLGKPYFPNKPGKIKG